MINLEEQVFMNQLISDLWQNGRLRYKLKSHQLALYNSIMQSTGLKYVINCSRRFGKTFIFCLIAIEFALLNKDVHIRFAAPTQKQLTEIIQPIFGIISADAPNDYKPIWNSKFGYYLIPNTESYIHIAGCNEGGMENLRGHVSHLNIIDEAASIDNLEYLIKHILLPQTLTTSGRMLIASTPPTTPDHYFRNLCEEAYASNEYSIYDIYQNTSLTDELISLYRKESGGETSTTWQREYLCKFVVDENIVIIPEWHDRYIVEIERDEFYKFYKAHESMDIGGKHKTVILYGYYDFKKAWDAIQIQMELVKPKQMSKANIILSVWNGFKKIDIANFLSELEDRLQGIAYYNDKQIKEEHLYKLDNEDVEFFKVIVEEME